MKSELVLDPETTGVLERISEKTGESPQEIVSRLLDFFLNHG